MMRKVGYFISDMMVCICFWRTERKLKRVVRREKRLSVHLLRLKEKREQLITFQHNLINKYPFLQPSENDYQKWLSVMVEIAVSEYGFSRKTIESLDDGTYKIFFLRGYRPEHAMVEIYGLPRSNNEQEKSEKDTEEPSGGKMPLSGTDKTAC